VKTAVRLLALLATLVTAGIAQDSVSADVPFGFTVNGQSMPAGRYTIEPARAPDYKVLFVRGEGKTALVLGPFLNSVNSNPRLVFERIGDQVFLTKVTGLDHEYEFPFNANKAAKTMNTAQVSEISLAAGQ
jgi:hypothetical protein